MADANPRGETRGETRAEAFLGVESSLSGRRWRARPVDERMAAAISQQYDLPSIVGRILASRGVTPEGVEAYLNPSLKRDLPDPSVLKDMDRAAERVADALAAGEKIAIFGDYDVDGATSSALLLRFFRSAEGKEGKARAYIPDRLTEGYGPNLPALLKLREEGVTLVLTVDCGTLSFAPLAGAAEAGLDVIVVDHHKAQTEHPRCTALINPNRLDQEPGLGQLAAVGVTFLLVVAVNRLLRARGWYGAERPEPDLRQWLDIVALGTICDVVPITGVNRALVVQGLKVMAARGNAGLRALADVAGLEEAPGTYHAGFILGPRVNAGGRVGESSLGTALLASDDDQEARQIAEKLHRHNAERQEIEALVQEEAFAQVLAEAGPGGEPGLLAFVAGDSWHPGVVGIVASRLKDRFHCPAIVISVAGDTAKGSARSIPGVDIGAAMIEALHRGLLVNGGGHAMAAGLTAKTGRLGELREFLEEWMAADIIVARAARDLQVDAMLTIGGASAELIDKISQAGPFGAGNAAPRLAFADLRLVKCDIVGKNHVRCFFTGGDGGRLKAVAFRRAEEPLGQALLGGTGRCFHIAGRLKKDDWKGNGAVELMLEDAAPAGL